MIIILSIVPINLPAFLSFFFSASLLCGLYFANNFEIAMLAGLCMINNAAPQYTNPILDIPIVLKKLIKIL